MSDLAKLFIDRCSGILQNESSCLLVMFDSDMRIIECNSRFDEYMKAWPSGTRLIDLLVRDSQAALMRLIATRADANECSYQNLHFRSHGDDLPNSYRCWATSLGNGSFILFAEPVPAIAEEQAKEYAVVTGELAVVTRQLQKANYELASSAKRLEEEIAEKKRMEEILAEARRIELQIGAQIQRALLIGQVPHSIPGVQIDAMNVPSGEVDGDFFDFFPYDDTCFDFLIGDVMGKGIPASLIGAGARFQFQRAIASIVYQRKGEMPPQPQEIVQTVHREVTGQLIDLERFITLNYSRFDLARNEMTFVDCGHTETLHYHAANGLCDYMGGENVPLGVRKDETYSQTTVGFEKGDLFFYYSDGLSDAESPDGEFYGESRIRDLVCGSGEMSASEFIATLKREIEDFTKSRGSRDDLTCTAIKII